MGIFIRRHFVEKLLIFTLLMFILACSHRSGVVLKDTDYLKYGTRASVIQKVWGEPDETMAFQDYRAKGYYHHSGATGSWGPYGGSVSGYSFGGTYTPTTIVWIYKEKEKALFFQQRGLLDEPYKYSAITIMSWKLVGWENLKLEGISPDEGKTRQTKTPEIKTAKVETYDDPIFIKSIPPSEIVKSSDLIQKSVQAVVTVKTEGGHASGFIISDDGYLITSIQYQESIL
jgi:hypothetical protein